jgi:hypothetical protein
MVRTTRAAVSESDLAALRAGLGAGDKAGERSLLLETEAAPAVALVEAAWPALAPALHALSSGHGDGSAGSGGGGIAAAAAVDFLRAVAMLPLRRRADLFAAAAAAAAALAPAAPVAALRFAADVAEQWGTNSAHETALRETARATVGAMAPSATEAPPDVLQALMEAASALLAHCPAMFVMLPAFADATAAALHAAAAHEVATATAALKYLGQVGVNFHPISHLIPT